MSAAKSLGVFCASALPPQSCFREAVARLGTLLGENGIELVYGGGRVGLMGVLADAALAAGARVTGVIPSALHGREVAHTGLTRLVVVADMHERKRQIFALSDAIAILPGGLGTLDEALEAITLKQLAFLATPIVLLNLAGYWDPLITLVDHVIAEGFARKEARTLFSVVAQADDIIAACIGGA